MSSNQTKIKPSQWFYVVGIIVLLSGPIISGIFLFSSVFSTMNALTQIPSIQVVVPGKSDVTFSQTGKYTIFYEYQSVIKNRVYSTGENIPGIQVSLISKDIGYEIPLSTTPISSTYTIGARSGTGLFDFTIDKPGIYEITGSYPSTQGQQKQQERPEIVLSIIHVNLDKMTSIIMGTVISGSAMFFVPFLAGIVIIVITFLKRRRAKIAMH